MPKRSSPQKEGLARIALMVGLLVVATAGGAQPQRTSPEDLADVIQEASQGETVHLVSNATYDPIVIDRPLTLIGAPGATIAPSASGIGITILDTHDVTLDRVSTTGGATGILVVSSTNVEINEPTVEGAQRRGIHVRDGHVIIDDCVVRAMTSPDARGIEIVNAESRPPSVVRGCYIEGPVWEGLASRLAHVNFEDNHVSGSKQRGIAVTEMSAGTVHNNAVTDAAGNAYFCGDMSHCTIIGNSAKRIVAGGAPMRSSQGHGVVVQYNSVATIEQLAVESISGNSVFTSVNGTITPQAPTRPTLIWLSAAAGIVIALSVGLGYRRRAREDGNRRDLTLSDKRAEASQ